MPCYDHRNDPSYIREELREDTKRQVEAARKSFLHNSPVAELLCSVMKEVPPFVRESLILDNTKLAHWWHDHQERDRKKAAIAKPKVVSLKRKRTVR